jgi:hypothetical protein
LLEAGRVALNVEGCQQSADAFHLGPVFVVEYGPVHPIIIGGSGLPASLGQIVSLKPIEPIPYVKA